MNISTETQRSAQREHRLVKGSKSSTGLLSLDDVPHIVAEHQAERLDLWTPTDHRAALHAGRRAAVVRCEMWRDITSDEPEKGKPRAYYTPLESRRAHYRAVLISETLGKQSPPMNHGDRWSEALSAKAAKKISDSGEYLNIIGNGYKTFLTLTLNQESRDMLARWDAGEHDADGYRGTLGGMVRELLNAMQQRARCGLTLNNETTGQPERVPMAAKPFQFCWVAECPKNEAGENNPHVHILLTWRVKPKHFKAWAAWIENLWAKGYCKLEKIREPKAAGAYILKACGYVGKGKDGTQGRIRGNRYNISMKARPPVARFVARLSAAWEGLQNLLSALRNTGRECWPVGSWVSEYAFGASGRESWATLIKHLRAAGWKMHRAPKNYAAEKFGRQWEQSMSRKLDRMRRWYLDAVRVLGERAPQLDLYEINHPPIEAYA